MLYPATETCPQSKKFARRMPGETNANVACELYADVHLIEPPHLPMRFAPGAGKGNRLPAVTGRGISIVVPDLAISIGPTNHSGRTQAFAEGAAARANNTAPSASVNSFITDLRS